jgi:hypothetical protein
MKAFKYFDLNNNGTVEPEEFAKAIEKIGIMIPTRQVSICPYFRFDLCFFACAKDEKCKNNTLDTKILIILFI